MARSSASAAPYGGDDDPTMATVHHLRPVERPELDRKAAELRAAGMIGGDHAPGDAPRAPAKPAAGDASEPLTGEVLPPARGPRITLPSLDSLRTTLGDGDAVAELARELAIRSGRGLLLDYPGAVLRGLAVAGQAWWKWVTAAEIKQAVVEAGRLHEKWKEVGALKKTRWKVTIALAVPGTGALALTVVLAPVTPIAIAAGVVSLGLAAAGRRTDGTPGRKPLLSSRRGMSWTIGGEGLDTAFQDAGVIGKTQRLALTARPAREGDGWAITVDLPPGGKASRAIARREDLASALGVDEVQLILNRVRGKGGHAGRLSMWVADQDPYAVAPTMSKLGDLEHFDFWNAVPFGSTARGERIDLPLVWTSLLVGAIPRMGKTYAARIPATAAALDPYVRLIGWDGKGGKDWQPYEALAHRIGIGDDDYQARRLMAVLEECVADVQWRYATLRAMSDDLCPESKVTPGITRNPQLKMPLVLIWIDEVQNYLENKTPIETGVDHRGKPKFRNLGDIICDLLTYIAKTGPAAGYILLVATQKPDAEVIPDRLRGQIGTRLALRTMTWQASDTILGAGSNKAGYDSSTLLRSHKGVGLLLGADGETTLAAGEAVTVRTDLLEIKAVRAACERGRELRLAAGTLTGDAAGDTAIGHRVHLADDAVAVADAPGPAATAGAPAAPAIPTILLDVRDVIDATGHDRIRTAVLLEALADLRTAEYDGLTPTDLSEMLGDNVSPVQLGKFDGFANPQGYKLAHVETEIDRITGA